jgi:hypothetical protein
MPHRSATAAISAKISSVLEPDVEASAVAAVVVLTGTVVVALPFAAPIAGVAAVGTVTVAPCFVVITRGVLPAGVGAAGAALPAAVATGIPPTGLDAVGSATAFAPAALGLAHSASAAVAHRHTLIRDV